MVTALKSTTVSHASPDEETRWNLEPETLNCLPLITRELRASSRRWTTYWLRLLAASAVLLGLLVWLGAGSSSIGGGSKAFGLMHQILLGAIWVFVPLMTCDCLSQEKREGTLGLLFLTNLRAGEIVLAKTIAHCVRALTLWLAVVPMLTIPLLMGGLSWKEIFLSCCLTFASLCAAVGAGLFASALSRQNHGAIAWAATLAFISHFVVATLFFILVDFCVTRSSGVLIVGNRLTFPTVLRRHSVGFLWNHKPGWEHVFRNTTASDGIVTASIVFVVFAVVALFLFGALILAPTLRGSWQDKPRTKRQAEMHNVLFKPIFWLGFFKRWMRRSLDRNPIGWLQKRNWQGRMTAWIWLALMSSFSTVLAYEIPQNYRDYSSAFQVLAWLLLGTFAFVAAGSFRNERESGALEILLVTPLSERQIISGRLRGLWSQFLPAFVIWIAVVLYLSGSVHEIRLQDFSFWLIQYLAVPAVGLYFSLQSRFVLLSWLATLFVCFALPLLLHFGLQLFRWWLLDLVRLDIPPISLTTMLFLQLLTAAFLLWRLHVNLRRRSFA